MLVVCPGCGKRYKVRKSNVTYDVPCICGKTISVLPWLSYHQVITELKEITCPLCERVYDMRQYRNETEIACTCGNLLVARHGSPDDDVRGRRQSDHDFHLREAELHGLADTSRLIHSSVRNLEKLLRLIVRVTNEMLAVEGSSVILRDKKEGDLVFYAVTGEKTSELASFRLAEGEGIVGNCIVNRSAIIVNNVQEDTRFSNKADDKSGFVTRSILCVPLAVEGECIGALEVVNKKAREGFSKHDLLLAEAVASQIAVAIHNVQLTEEAIKAARLAAVGQAVTGVAHCVKNMLNGLNGGLYLTKSDLKKGGQENSKGYEMLERNMDRLKGLVYDMLSYSKDREPEYEQSDVNELAVSVVELMEEKAKEKDVVLRLKKDESIPPAVIDPKGIYRSVLNLVSNAIDACEGREEANVSVATRPAGQDTAGIVVDVRDTGCGMDAETVKKIFHPFVSSKGSKGTGLGLSVTRKIIEEHGGRISVESEPGKGSTFSVHLPAAPPAQG